MREMEDELEDRLKAAGIEVITTWTVGKDFVHENQIWKGVGHVHQFTYDDSKTPIEKTETDS